MDEKKEFNISFITSIKNDKIVKKPLMTKPIHKNTNKQEFFLFCKCDIYKSKHNLSMETPCYINHIPPNHLHVPFFADI